MGKHAEQLSKTTKCNQSMYKIILLSVDCERDRDMVGG